MYSNLHAEMIHSQQQALATRAVRARDVENVGAGSSPRSGRSHGRARRAIAAIAVCVAATSVVAISDAGANQMPTRHNRHVSAAQFEREIHTLNSLGFVATSCEIHGTLMKNYSSDQTVLLSW
jgi:hypothetical protein